LFSAFIWWPDSSAQQVEEPRPGPPKESYSNVAAADYVGPLVCGECHEEKLAAWENHRHRSMNQLAVLDKMAGDFDGTELRYGAGTARFLSKDGAAFMVLEDTRARRRYRVTRTIGSRYLQEYVGVLVEGPEPLGHEAYSREVRLPFGYWLRPGRWLHQQYFDSWYGPEFGEDDDLQVDPYALLEEPWKNRCAWCHNTYPFEFRLARLANLDLGNGIEQLFEWRDQRPGPAPGATGALPTEALVTVGISCESCHFGGREHAVDGKPIRFVPTAPGLATTRQVSRLQDDRKSSRTVNAICAQCHSAPSPLFPGGAATRNSSEALDLMTGSCASQIRCTHCHDPHQTGPGALAADQQKHVDACLSCHQNLADSMLARAHSRHGDEVSCLDCHMPRIVQGVTDSLRTHHISSPTDPLMLGAGPNACNLCHLDRGLDWTIGHLEREWGAEIDRKILASGPYGGVSDLSMGERWLKSEAGIDRITAAAAYARSQLGKEQLPTLMRGLLDEVAYRRMRYLFALEDILGRRLPQSEYDPAMPPKARRRQVELLEEQMRSINQP
jgi:hypothetical protein